jgi:thiamine-phosphate pyrophosphorylase
MYKNKSFKYYVFLERIDEIIRNNLLKFKNINVIIDLKNTNQTSIEKTLSIIKFCKDNKIPFFLIDNYQVCTKHHSNGIFLSSRNKQIIKPLLLKKNFRIIGSAHNQQEYFLKTKQYCNLVMLSPLFFNKKYSKNKILNLLKFNLISRNWNKKLCALGGINDGNIKKVKITIASSIAFKRLIENPKIKKPAYNLM